MKLRKDEREWCIHRSYREIDKRHQIKLRNGADEGRKRKGEPEQRVTQSFERDVTDIYLETNKH